MYNPGRDIINNINSYLPYLGKLIVIDNSTQQNYLTIPNIDKVTYIHSGENVGIGKALNIAAEIAIREGYQFLLTMDQDSFFQPVEIEKLLSYLNQDLQKIGIISPKHSAVRYKNEIEELPFVMTSGNILNLEAYKICGPYLEELFIDHIDHEYGLRLNSSGFKVLQLNTVTLDHQLGNKKSISILGQKIYTFISHNPLRNYYMVRNGFYVAHLYKKTNRWFYYLNLKLVLKEILKILLFENKKLLRLKSAFRGYSDYKLRKLGVWQGY